MSKLTSTRRRHTNSKLGCLNCKRKKIRCDENLPECWNCSRSKKDKCSYLSLSLAEINRIKLAHSLRNSQNKLLDRNYRLPTSTNNINKHENGSPIYVNENLLDFRFELTDLPLKTLSIPNLPIQFNNLTVNDFSKDFKVTNDDECFDSKSDTSTNKEKLPNGVVKPIAFKRLKYKSLVHNKVNFQDNTEKVPPDLSYHVVQGKISMLDHFNDFILSLSPNSPDTSIAYDAFICLGQTVILNQFYQLIKYSTPFKAANKKRFVDEFEKKCFERYGRSLSKLRMGIDDFSNLKNDEKNLESMNYYAALLCHSSCYLTYSILVLNFSAECFFNSSKGIFAVFETYIKFIHDNKLKQLGILDFLSNNMQYNITCINIPSYNPTFLFEIRSNLKSLESIYNFDSINFKVDKLNNQFSKLSSQFNNLIDFFNNSLLSTVYSTRDVNYVATYSPGIMYELLKKWQSIFPTEAMTYKPIIDINHPEESIYLKDLATTLYMYYHSVGASLDSVFPACKYLFTISYILPNNKFYFDKTIMSIHKDNKYHEIFKTSKLLQRHNYFAMRLFAFFRRRYRFYQSYIKWTDPFNENLKKNRLVSRVMSNYLEIPIKSFNTTLIRPEHYPTMLNNISLEDLPTGSFFTRTDETLTQKLYTRNIETLNFFDESSILQYDYETMLLLRDYRPYDDDHIPDQPKLNSKIIRNYCEDKTIILYNSK